MIPATNATVNVNASFDAIGETRRNRAAQPPPTGKNAKQRPPDRRRPLRP